MTKKNQRRAKNEEGFRRLPPSRDESDRVLIVTEGTKTEPDYFNRLKTELGLTTAEVKITGKGGSAPIRVVETAEQILKKDDEFDQIYLVFDRDTHSTYDVAIKRVSKLANQRQFRKKTVCAITSVPCFEVWFILHVSDSCKPYEVAATSKASPAKSLISDLRKKKLPNGEALFAKYKKTSCEDFYSQITNLRGKAINRASGILEQARKSGDRLHHENPSTRVHILVKALEKIGSV